MSCARHRETPRSKQNRGTIRRNTLINSFYSLEVLAVGYNFNRNLAAQFFTRPATRRATAGIACALTAGGTLGLERILDGNAQRIDWATRVVKPVLAEAGTATGFARRHRSTSGEIFARLTNFRNEIWSPGPSRAEHLFDCLPLTASVAWSIPYLPYRPSLPSRLKLQLIFATFCRSLKEIF